MDILTETNWEGDFILSPGEEIAALKKENEKLKSQVGEYESRGPVPPKVWLSALEYLSDSNDSLRAEIEKLKNKIT